MTDINHDCSFPTSCSTGIENTCISTTVEGDSFLDRLFGLGPSEVTVEEPDLIQSVWKDGADECEHCRSLPEPKEYMVVLGLRRLIQHYTFICGLEYTFADCPLTGRACKVKLEGDRNRGDLASIGLIELGTRDIEVIFEDDEDDGSNFDEFDATDELS